MSYKNEVNEVTPKRISGEKRKLSAEEDVVVIDGDEIESDEIENELEADVLSQLLQEVYEDDLKAPSSKSDPTKKGGIGIIEIDELDTPDTETWDDAWLTKNDYGFLRFKHVTYTYPRFDITYDHSVVSPQKVQGEQRAAEKIGNVEAFIDSIY